MQDQSSLDFVAVDIETANADLSSICQVGVASFRDGHFERGWKSVVNPQEELSNARRTSTASFRSLLFPTTSDWPVIRELSDGDDSATPTVIVGTNLAGV
jgi:hypothetical protein